MLISCSGTVLNRQWNTVSGTRGSVYEVLRWNICQRSRDRRVFLSPIIGATKTQYLDDSVGAFDIKLTAEDFAYLEEPYVPHEIVGAIDKNPAQGVILLDEKK